MNQQPIQVYITADALVSSLGFTTQENLEAIRDYRSGICLQEDGQISDTPILAGMIDDARFQEKVKEAGLTGYTRLEQLFILTISQIIAQTGISPADDDCRLILATTKGNIHLLAEQTDNLDEKVFMATMSERIGSYFQAKHPVETISNACISGVSAMIVGKRMIEAGICKKVIVAGGDILSHFITSGFLAFKSVSQEICRPYDSRRDGLNLGEACGAVLLSLGKVNLPENESHLSEDATGNSRFTPYYNIALSGGAISNDANHISGPSRTGDGLYFAIRQAMEEASVGTKDISFVNTHGTATVYNDEMESKAIHLAGLQNAPIHSLKSYFGHTLGAAGVVESIICIHELMSGTLFGTLGYEEEGVPMPVIASSTHQPLRMKSCVKTASGFGGCNAAIVLELTEADQQTTKTNHSSTSELAKPHITATVLIHNSEVYLNGNPVLTSESKEFAPFIREAFKNLHESNLKFYKMSDLCKLGYVAAGYLLQGKSFEPQEIGIILANASASLDTDIEHQIVIDKDGDETVSPATFVYTLPNTVAGEICIRHKIQGENTFFIAPAYDEEKLTQYAHTVMRKGRLKACIVGWCELLGNPYQAEFKLIEIESWKN